MDVYDFILWQVHDCEGRLFACEHFIELYAVYWRTVFQIVNSCWEVIVDSAKAPSLFSPMLRCMRLMELWPGRESPESISGPFNRTPCRKGFNLLIREASEVRSCCCCQSQGKTLGNYFQCWQLVIQEAKAKTTHSSMMLQASKPCAAFFFFLSFIYFMPTNLNPLLWTNKLLSLTLFCFSVATTTLHFQHI